MNPEKGWCAMLEVLKYLDLVTDHCQKKKVLHKESDIIVPVFFAILAGADEWTSYEIFGKEHEKFLRGYLELP